MNILNIFRRNSENAKIEFGNRGEGIIYHHGDKELYVEFTFLTGYRIYPISLQAWKNGASLTELEKEKVFTDVINFVRRKKGKPIIVINTDDPNKSQWESLSSINLSIIEKIEHTSNEENQKIQQQSEAAFQSKTDEFFKQGKQIKMKGTVIKNQEDLDKFTENLKKKRDT